MNSLSVGFKQEPGQRFCEKASILQFGVTFLHFQPALWVLLGVAKGPEVMQLALEASASWRKLLIGSKEESTLVILKDFVG